MDQSLLAIGSGRAVSDFAVIVVGAGIAGLSAGQTLKLYGVPAVVLAPDFLREWRAPARGQAAG